MAPLQEPINSQLDALAGERLLISMAERVDRLTLNKDGKP